MKVLLFTVLLFGCGIEKEVTIKDYRLNSNLYPGIFQQLVYRYNVGAGQTVLTYESDPAKANSTITVVDGLSAMVASGTPGLVVVGQGQPTEWAQGDEKIYGPYTFTEHMGMSLRFDNGFVVGSSLDTLDVIFAHEVGHGLEMVHTPNPNDVMYFDVSAGDKDFDAYFNNVRKYMGE